MENLPVLHGSEKQIAWAEKIRLDTIAKWDRELAWYENKINEMKSGEEKDRWTEFKSKLISIFDFAVNNKNSNDWITNRDMFFLALIPISDRPALSEKIGQSVRAIEMNGMRSK